MEMNDDFSCERGRAIQPGVQAIGPGFEQSTTSHKQQPFHQVTKLISAPIGYKMKDVIAKNV
jgi:hypothetical protein